mmetsp:Transcript_30096/g.54467  ORF Transcript_30096/g.54467 Transcript_30096/m.54467 type:complete len:661 (-) Transcript_30096:98-2080(-)|eukprot:CAMPEP_0197624928 /NCGR_PEP_ID=MMETSP1338-20131121/4421_1 /TAXON_ID=43686 ORGANISM="Pelagodinium beii, Strain RCC1491" /NCGR_SAMPLE_ID=MMETSP1338 /ASSEMBLY_ACC=CAM_ASM_000754 /LENGTH=660 /DNA_ID=CAMNT_0043195187 /DNA_START=83 /DNA_END=2065 /DNA_ORIENTATION=-
MRSEERAQLGSSGGRPDTGGVSWADGRRGSVEVYDTNIQAKKYVIAPNQKDGTPFVIKLFMSERLAREAFTFLAPQHSSDDLTIMDPVAIGPWIGELGERLYHEGSLPGLPCWEMEESPEIKNSVDLWRKALEVDTGPAFDELVQKSFREAEAGFFQLGRLGPRLAGLRWTSCLRWLSSYCTEVMKASGGGGNCTALTADAIDRASREAKKFIFTCLGGIMEEPPVVTLFDFDLMGQGVWHGGGKQPLPEEAKDEWYRRGNVFDLCRIAHQAVRVPPEDLNPSVPHLMLIQPYGTPNEYIRLPEVPRMIIDKHGWVAEALPAPVDVMPAKAWVPGKVLHMEIPAPPDFDLEDPEVRAKVERGEDLGKGHQEDGKPGAVHGSVGLMYAAAGIQEGIENAWFYPGIIQLEGFMEMFLTYGPPLRSISLAGADADVDEDVLELLKLAGESVLTLDLEQCGIDGSLIDALMDMLKDLSGLRNLDLGCNKLDGPSALSLIRLLGEARVDLQTIRLDKNPFGQPEVLKNEIAACLATRGESVVAGGDLVLHLGDNAVRWCAGPRENTLAQRLRDDGADILHTSSLKEMDRAIVQREAVWARYEKNDPAAQSSGGRDWLRRMRLSNVKLNKHPLIKFYRKQRTWAANNAKSNKEEQKDGGQENTTEK